MYLFRRLLLFVLLFLRMGEAAAEPAALSEALILSGAKLQADLETRGWLLHGQATFIMQAAPAFPSPYQGASSLTPGDQARQTFSTDFILGRKLWEGAEIIVDSQIFRGFGLSNTLGVAAFPNGEAVRLGGDLPQIYFARLFLRQTFALSEDTVTGDPEDLLHFNNPMPRERVTLSAGKFSLFDFFDDNKYAHDPRTQFLNWAMVGATAYDFAADSRGLTNGIVAEYDNGTWGLRAGAFMVSAHPNGLDFDPEPFRNNQFAFEIDRFFKFAERPGAVRLLYGFQRTASQPYDTLIANGFANQDRNPAGSSSKHMLIVNFEQEIAEDIGVFGRFSWNDGQSQSWMYSEQDRAASLGMSIGGSRWGRAKDTVGLASNIGGLSDAHRRFLEAGGIGFLTGDGRLNYAPEWVNEIYYNARLAPGVNAALDYQYIVNPAYNADRGPVHVFSLRLHSQF
jgi:high affinity Mn2+ porin